MTASTIAKKTPRLVKCLADIMGCGPERVEILDGGADVRYHWPAITRAQLDSGIGTAWAAEQEERSKLPHWIQQRECISCRWPSDDRFEFCVIVRDPERDIWCMEPEVMQKHPAYLRAFCPDCQMARSHCKCK